MCLATTAVAWLMSNDRLLVNMTRTDNLTCSARYGGETHKDRQSDINIRYKHNYTLRAVSEPATDGFQASPTRHTRHYTRASVTKY